MAGRQTVYDSCWSSNGNHHQQEERGRGRKSDWQTISGHRRRRCRWDKSIPGAPFGRLNSHVPITFLVVDSWGYHVVMMMVYGSSFCGIVFGAGFDSQHGVASAAARWKTVEDQKEINLD